MMARSGQSAAGRRLAAGVLLSASRCASQPAHCRSQLTLVVVTAQVASSFVAQGSSRAEGGPPVEPATPEVTLAELDRRLAGIEW